MTLKNKRIFIVEDNIPNRALYGVYLNQAGAVLFFDKWGVGTRERMEKLLPIDLVILDLKLPNGIMGYDIFDELRATSSLATIPIVAVTAEDAQSTIPIVQAKGFNGFIGKPIMPWFAAEIDDVINGLPVWHEGPRGGLLYQGWTELP